MKKAFLIISASIIFALAVFILVFSGSTKRQDTSSLPKLFDDTTKAKKEDYSLPDFNPIIETKETETESVTEETTFEESTETPEHEHTFVETVLVASTCTTKGKVYRECSECGYSETVTKSKLSHKYKITIKPNSEGNVIQSKVCATCGKSLTSSLSFETFIGYEQNITRAQMVEYLTSHENDEYYLTTPYKGNANAFPNGAANYSSLSTEEKKAAVEAAALLVAANKTSKYGVYYPHKTGKPGMNCSGLVGHIMYSLNPDFVTAFNKQVKNSSYLGFGVSGKSLCLSVTNAWLWYIMICRNSSSSINPMYDNIGRYVVFKFPSKDAMLSSGLLKKGDICMAICPNRDDGLHLGIFWGNTSSEDLFWVSEPKTVRIKTMKSPGPLSQTYWYIVPLYDESRAYLLNSKAGGDVDDETEVTEDTTAETVLEIIPQ